MEMKRKKMRILTVVRNDSEAGETNANNSDDNEKTSEESSELLNESTTENGAFSNSGIGVEKEKEAQKSSLGEKQNGNSWKLCNTSAGPDYIPCLDNLAAIRKLTSTKHYEHRERHCPENPPTCLVPLPEGYQRPIEWPTSREKIWYHNVPHTKLAAVKGHQNWVKVSGEYLIFPGGGTQFKNGALHYIDTIQQSVPEVAWGKRSRVVLDVGCGVASFGGFLFERDVLTMSLAPKDEHEAQVQFALERGIPAISAVMGTKRLPYPGRVFDIVHCARCRVPWHAEGGKLLLELNRLLRPGGFFVWSATPIYQKLPEDVEIWKKLTQAMCWEVVSITKDELNGVGIAVYRKPTSNECYEQRNVPLQACMHKVPIASSERGSQWPEQWPARVDKVPYWLLSSEVGVYGKPAPEDFAADYAHWKRVVKKSYLNGLGINWSTVRNVMDMRAVYGGFAAALRELNLWVMNVVPIDAPDTLPIIYERGLLEFIMTGASPSVLTQGHMIFSMLIIYSRRLKASECNFKAVVSEWEIRMTYSKDNEGLLYAQKTMWRPKEEEIVTYAIA
ncbi:UNVERIFIED_CONTAM: putative methyltransferase PMT26 [Sesamum calycinum]|uniref:Methyltransferase n=1 Tax=Sesamum calycinum TaxID=2727403 RepID=A0AAW2SWX1_9LAMI